MHQTKTKHFISKLLSRPIDYLVAFSSCVLIVSSTSSAVFQLKSGLFFDISVPNGEWRVRVPVSARRNRVSGQHGPQLCRQICQRAFALYNLHDGEQLGTLSHRQKSKSAHIKIYLTHCILCPGVESQLS